MIAWIFIITGILAVAFALFFLLIIKYSFFKGLGIVLLATGIFQIVQGCYSLSIPANLHHQAAGNFTWSLPAIALSGGLLMRLSSHHFWKGMGLGMVIQGCLSFALLMLHAGEL